MFVRYFFHTVCHLNSFCYSKLWTPIESHLLDGNSCKIFLDIHDLSLLFFKFLITIYHIQLIFPTAKLEAHYWWRHKLGNIEYLIATDNILLLHSNLNWNQALLMGFQHDLMLIQKWFTFYWATLYVCMHVHVLAFCMRWTMLRMGHIKQLNIVNIRPNKSVNSSCL